MAEQRVDPSKVLTDDELDEQLEVAIEETPDPTDSEPDGDEEN